MPVRNNHFTAARLTLASPETILAWSHGEVTSPDTLHHRTLAPIPDGLFCQRIFGPVRDHTCRCGKFRGGPTTTIHRGVICQNDDCGVEVQPASVRRDRMGHISLAAPVAHIWYSRGPSSPVGLLLDMTESELVSVLACSAFVITQVNSQLIASQVDSATQLAERTEDSAAIQLHLEELSVIALGAFLPVARHRELRTRYGRFFVAHTGGEALRRLLQDLDVHQLVAQLRSQLPNLSGPDLTRALKRLHCAQSFADSGVLPEYMALTVLPVLPPDLRPVLSLPGGNVASSDLNDLYRRVIHRNNRLRAFREREAPELILLNEQRMLQLAVDALYDNSHLPSPASNIQGLELRSLSDGLRGKKGRFRQNLLGKRVDYSGRSVIVAGPHLKLGQCGMPRRMALELFRPFVLARLFKDYGVDQRTAGHILSNAELIVRHPMVWEALEQEMAGKYVLLNRAPTLHRLSIQAFEPILIDGDAIQLHPLVCSAFNADFDGDQMAVHLPLTAEALQETRDLMGAVSNLISPSSGEPIALPNLDIVLGLYDMSIMDEADDDGATVRSYPAASYALTAHELGAVSLRERIVVRIDGDLVETTPGRLIIREVLPDPSAWKNAAVQKDDLKHLVMGTRTSQGAQAAADLLDRLMTLGFKYARQLSVSVAISDLVVPPGKDRIVAEAESKVAEIADLFLDGILTERERHRSVVDIWNEAIDQLTAEVEDVMADCGGLYLMASSGAKGNISNIKQMTGMRGLMANPKGETIERPIRSNFRDGLSVLEYFISTHGSRKGLADTALRTADAGYLTRRLVDAAQDVLIREGDCGTTRGLVIDRAHIATGGSPFEDELKFRYAARRVVDPHTWGVLLDRNTLLDNDAVDAIIQHGVTAVTVRSPLHCRTRRGLCSKCYGLSLARLAPAVAGEAVGVIAAQSIGEPGTQLTMRTFHAGGVAGADITSGLPRVVELFEARRPKVLATVASVAGLVSIVHQPEGVVVRISSEVSGTASHPVPREFDLLVGAGDQVAFVQPLAQHPANLEPALLSTVSGRVVGVTGDNIDVQWTDTDLRDHHIPGHLPVIAAEGQLVEAGQPLTEGPLDPHDILATQGVAPTQRYLIDEVQKVYRAQGVNIHSKHIEVIVAQMLAYDTVIEGGDSSFMPGALVPGHNPLDAETNGVSERPMPIQTEPVLLGITRVALNADGFLAAAAFQRTTQVLREAAIQAKTDTLQSVKSAIILGRLIPAQLATDPEAAIP